MIPPNPSRIRRLVGFDVGTNSILCLTAEWVDERIRPIRQEAASPRLGRNVRQTGRIEPKSIQRAILSINRMKIGLSDHPIVAVGTQVFRCARNSREAVDAIRNETGLKIEVLSPEEEAEWSFRGALEGLDLRERVVVADVGGGSTEFISGAADRIASCRSFPIGAVTLTESAFQRDPPSTDDVARAESQIQELLGDWGWTVGTDLVAVGGTATTLAGLELGLDQYAADAVHGSRLTTEQITRWIGRLACVPLAERRTLIPFDPERADIVIAGSLIVREIVRHGGGCIVSDRGLRFGIALREFIRLSSE